MPLVGEVIRASVKEAARLLDTSEHAVRQRLYRGSLESEKDERGNVVVLIPESRKVRGCEKGSNGNGCVTTQTLRFLLLTLGLRREREQASESRNV